jgi:hypothetical protein
LAPLIAEEAGVPFVIALIALLKRVLNKRCFGKGNAG